jgi:hypothetical protein
VRVTWQTSHIGRNIIARSANDELSRLRSIRKLQWTTACHRIISTGQPLRFQEASNVLTDVIFVRDNGTCLHRRSSSELCQGQMYLVTQSAQIHHRLQRHIYTTPPLESQRATKRLTSSASISLLTYLLYLSVYLRTRVVVRCCPT